MSEAQDRTPQEILRSHGRALIKGDLGALVANYSEDCVFITPEAVYHGREGVREAQAKILADLAGARFEYRTNVFEGNLVFLEWSASAESFTVDDGVDTLVLGSGEICAQTITYHITQRSIVGPSS